VGIGNNESHESPSAAFGRNQKPALAKTPSAQRREDGWQTTEDAEFSALGDLCVFARDIIVCAPRLYVILARKSAQENKI